MTLADLMRVLMPKLHPVLTLDENGELLNKHYDNGEESTIEKMEKIYSVRDMVGYCRVAIYKYHSREKGQNDSDDVKIAAYTRYLDVLNSIESQYNEVTIHNYWNIAGIEWSYR